MQVIEQEIMRRFPDWFEGARGGIGKAIVRSYGKFCRFAEIEKFLAEYGHLKGQLLVGQRLRAARDEVVRGFGDRGLTAAHPMGTPQAAGWTRLRAVARLSAWGQPPDSGLLLLR